MAKAYDYLLDENGDLLFKNGDLVVGESDKQHIQDTINAHPGWWKEFPQDGVGLKSYHGSSGKDQQLQKSIRANLARDGYSFIKPPQVRRIDGRLVIYTNAVRN